MRNSLESIDLLSKFDLISNVGTFNTFLGRITDGICSLWNPKLAKSEELNHD
jgi:hypothetical protein